MPNSWHKAVNDFSPRLAVTIKLTRCSRTSIVFHGIERYAPALAALAPECKGCLETFCKGCHETEHVLWLEWGTSPALASRARRVDANGDRPSLAPRCSSPAPQPNHERFPIWNWPPLNRMLSG